MSVLNPNRPTFLDIVRQAEKEREAGIPSLLERAFPELQEQRSRINMSSKSDSEPGLPMPLPHARGPLRERAAEIRCPYCKVALHDPEERENGFCWGCEADAVDPGI